MNQISMFATKLEPKAVALICGYTVHSVCVCRSYVETCSRVVVWFRVSPVWLVWPNRNALAPPKLERSGETV